MMLVNPFFQPNQIIIAIKEGMAKMIMNNAETLAISELMLILATKKAAITKATAIIQMYLE